MGRLRGGQRDLGRDQGDTVQRLHDRGPRVEQHRELHGGGDGEQRERERDGRREQGAAADVRGSRAAGDLGAELGRAGASAADGVHADGHVGAGHDRRDTS